MGKLNGVMTPTTPTGLRVTRICSPARGEAIDFTGLAVAFVAVVAQDLCGPAHLGDALGLGLAFLGGQLETPVIGVALHDVCGRQQHRTALVDRGGGPAGPRVDGRGDGGVEIGGQSAEPPCGDDALWVARD